MSDEQPIGTILATQRARLNISLDQAVADTKLQRRVIEAFEATDFEHMPPRGYAQASLSSYARYLGINPAQILPVFQRQLDAYERAYGKLDVADTGSFAVRSAGSREVRTTSGRAASQRSFTGGGRAYEVSDSRSSSRPRSNTQRSDAFEPQFRRRDVRDLYDDGLAWRGSSTSGHSQSHDRSSHSYDTVRRSRDDAYRRPEDSRSTTRRLDAYSEASRSSRNSVTAGETRNRNIDDMRPSRRTSTAAGSVRGSDASTAGMTARTSIDDGYLGGSGSVDAANVRARRETAPQKITLRELLQGFGLFFSQNRVIATVVVGAIAIVVLVLALVGASSCSRAGSTVGASDPLQVEVVQGSSTTQQASSQDGAQAQTAARPATQLDASIDLATLPTGSTIVLTVAPEAPADPWVEAYVDDAAAGASIVEAGTTLQWTLERSARILLSTIDGVSIEVNGIAVTPTFDNGTYALNASVPQDQWPVAPEDQSPGEEQQDDGIAPYEDAVDEEQQY